MLAITVIMSMILVNNYVLSQFLGICPFLRIQEAGLRSRYGCWVIFVKRYWRPWQPGRFSRSSTGLTSDTCRQSYSIPGHRCAGTADRIDDEEIYAASP